MSEMTPHDATLAQNRAADPANSTWVSANAGSGKTRVLTDRVARLLLKQVPPQKILCLTYTKAAASHMQNQLFARLGSWAMLSDQELTERLAELGEEVEQISPRTLSHARTLFASALETPGGLKIQTIHSFCAALLRRFPLEAGVSPRFQEIDERSGKKLRADILETLADGSDTCAFDAMATYLPGDDPDSLMREISSNRARFLPVQTAQDIWKAFALPDGYSKADYFKAVWPDWADEVMHDLVRALATGGVTDNKNSELIKNLSLEEPSMKAAQILENMFVYGDSTKKPNTAKLDRFPTNSVRQAHPDLMEAVDDLMLRFEGEKANRQALATCLKTLALHQFAQAFLPVYEDTKQAHGWLDFDDLILKTKGLLTDSAMAQWVLFKLDGGIDHILVDEAQDTSPYQWDVVASLAEEFLTGEGARDVERTLFVVGDEKQSIFSFQGADPAAFEAMRNHFDSRLKQAQSHLNRHELLYSFRSSKAILRLVDGILENTDFGLAANVTHRAFHEELPGRVDLWPPIEPPEKLERANWFDPLDIPAANDPSVQLANTIATAIENIVQHGETITTAKTTRKVVYGDFLILVQRRSDIFHEIIKALKEKNLPVAGSDRLKIGGELAVKDLIALLSFMITPEDDLSLASALRSPLFGLTEQELFRLAHARKGFLWQEIRKRQEELAEPFRILTDLLSEADFLRPYEVLEHILTGHQGRENLIARLGPEAEDGIDALLTQAMQYEQAQAPNLTGFLEWFSADEGDIKRQMDTQSGEIRVMTVHGAKGLEAPIVILPDTAKRGTVQLGEIQTLAEGMPVWKSALPESPRLLKEAMETKRSFQEAERLRLLYVALTRAENWLIVCAAGNTGKAGESWYNHIETGMRQVSAVDKVFFGQNIKRYEPLGWGGSELDAETSAMPKAVSLPDWAKRPVSPPDKKSEHISPSKLGGAKVLQGAKLGRDETAALHYGSQIHALLEKLPGLDRDHWEQAARKILGATSDSDFTDLMTEVRGILESPDLEFIFSPNNPAEIPICAPVGTRKIFGVIDRLIVTETTVLAVDFKSNADVPKRVEDVPLGFLQQMGAYANALAQIYPDRQVETAILWSNSATLMRLTPQMVTDAFTQVSTS